MRRFRLVFAGACAVLAALTSVAYGDHVRQEAERVRSDAIARFGGEVAQLLVADESLEPGDIVSEANVSLRDWLAELAPAGALTSLDEVLGREVTVALAKGSPLTELTFRDESTLADVPEGHMAVSIPASERLGMAPNAAQGSRVLAYRVESKGVRIIASDMQVLSAPTAQASYASMQQVTLAVLPDDVAEVLEASASGDLRLVLPATGLEAGELDTPSAEAKDAAPEQREKPAGDSQAAAPGVDATGSDGAQAEADEQGEGQS